MRGSSLYNRVNFVQGSEYSPNYANLDGIFLYGGDKKSTRTMQMTEIISTQ